MDRLKHHNVSESPMSQEPNQRLLLPGRERLSRRAVSFNLVWRLRHAPQQKRNALDSPIHAK